MRQMQENPNSTSPYYRPKSPKEQPTEPRLAKVRVCHKLTTISQQKTRIAHNEEKIKHNDVAKHELGNNFIRRGTALQRTPPKKLVEATNLSESEESKSPVLERPK
jgi:hypothetical protein